MDATHCAGCVNDFYNGQNPYGIQECWSLKTATLEPFRLIHINRTPPYLNVPVRNLPTCYRAEKHVKAKPEALDSQGFWK